MEGIEKNHNKPRLGRLVPGQEFNSETPECESDA